MTAKRCRKRNRNGKACGAPAGPSGLCAIHADPDRARELGAKGGRGNRHASPDPPDEPLSPPKDALEVKLALGRIMADVHNGNLETRKATTAVYAATAFMKALENSDLESRIKALEERANDGIKKQS